MESVKKFFWWCAGVNEEILNRYPEEHNKYISIGATIFFTGLFASLAGGYALYFVFSGSFLAPLYAIVFGLIWGLAIFNLDRYIVLSMDKTQGVFKQFFQALPRILLAILIGLVISRPLELKIFDKEIKEYVRLDYLKKQRASIDTLTKTFEKKYQEEFTRLKSLKSQGEFLDNLIKTDREKLNHEIFGTKTEETSGKIGYGTFAKMKEENLKKQEVYLDTIRVLTAALENHLLERKKQEGLLDQRILTDKALDSAVNLSGFADRNAALGNLHKKPNGKVDTSTENAVNFIALLFIFFECLPVFVKLMSSKDPYDVAVSNQREIHVFESNTGVDIEKTAINKLDGQRVDLVISKRMDALSREYDRTKI